MKYLHPIRHASPESLVGQVYAQIRHDGGVVADPFKLHAPVPELLAGMWSIVRETTMVGQVPWFLKEAVAAAVSQANACPYCLDIHASAVRLPAASRLSDLIKQGRTEEIADPVLHALVTWARATGSASTVRQLPASFSAQERAELIGTAVAFHYINRLVNVFLPESLLPSLLRGGWLGGQIWSQVGHRLAHGRDQNKPRSTSLHFLPEAELPTELSWAAAAPSISRAFAGWAALLEKKGAEILSPQVHLVVREQLALWSGEVPSLGRGWVERAIAPLSGADQDAGRLVLLVALASSQIDARVIEAFRSSYATDAHLVGAAAWASGAAARRVASWLTPSTESLVSSHSEGAPGDVVNG
jgi:AhpD family alkylhydroperoxidase